MKSLLIILSILILIGCSSVPSKKDTYRTEKNQDKELIDTHIGVNNIPVEISGTDYIEKEYFIINQKDTSSFSCTILENRTNNKLSISLRYSSFNKMPNSFLKIDTNILYAQKSVYRKYREVSYEEQVKEFKYILNFVSKKYDLRNLRNIRMSMRVFEKLSIGITEKYLECYGNKFDYSSNKKVVHLIEESDFISDLKKNLASYSIFIEKIFVDGLYYYVSEDTVKEKDKNKVLKRNKKPIIDGILIFKIK